MESRYWGRFLLNIWTTLSVRLAVSKLTAKPMLPPGPDLSPLTSYHTALEDVKVWGHISSYTIWELTGFYKKHIKDFTVVFGNDKTMIRLPEIREEND